MTRLVLLAAAAAASRFCKDFHTPRPETLYKLLRTVPEHVLAVDKLRRRLITPADLVAWRRNLTERWGDLDAAARTARRTVLNSTFWAEQIRSMA